MEWKNDETHRCYNHAADKDFACSEAMYEPAGNKAGDDRRRAGYGGIYPAELLRQVDLSPYNRPRRAEQSVRQSEADKCDVD
jgi:hypothetical protein